MKRTWLIPLVAGLAAQSFGTDPFVPVYQANYGTSQYSERVFSVSEDKEGAFYQLVRQVLAFEEITIVKFGKNMVQETVARTGHTNIGTVLMDVNRSTGAMYSLVTTANPLGQDIRVIGFKPDGTKKWDISLGTFPSSHSTGGALVDSFIVDEEGHLCASYRIRQSNNAQILVVVRLNEATGGQLWSRSILTPLAHGVAVASGAGLFVVPQSGTDLTLRGFKLSTGATSFTKIHHFGSADDLTGLIFDPTSRSFYASGGATASSAGAKFLTQFTTSGSRTWVRMTAPGDDQAGALRLAPGGDVVDIVSNGANIAIERVRSNGTRVFRKEVPDCNLSLRSGLSLDSQGNVFYVYPVFDVNLIQLPVLRVCRLMASGDFDWQIEVGAPFFGLSPSQGGFSISGVLAPRGTGYDQLRIGGTRRESPGSSFNDFNTVFLGPPSL